MKEKLKIIVIRLHWLFNTQLGINVFRLVKSIPGGVRYFRDLLLFKRLYNGEMVYRPCLHDWYEAGGSTKSEYFVQDLLIARAIYQKSPKRHVDVGSRVDGFVANVASFRDVEVFDVRPTESEVCGITFKTVDFMSLPCELEAYSDSVSCLHALEHFGLGRYGDPIDSIGYQKGLVNLGRVVKPGGRFYLSVPVGRHRVEFNANWVFDPYHILELVQKNGFELDCFLLIQVDGSYSEHNSIPLGLSQLQYALGVYLLKKTETC